MSAIILVAYGLRSFAGTFSEGKKASGKGQSSTEKPAPRQQAPPTRKEKLQPVLDYAKSLVGKPYRAGGSKPDRGFDCSGFVRHVYATSMDLKLPRSSRGMAKFGTSVPLDEVKVGDLLFFTGSNAESGTVGHVALVLDPSDGIAMIHASSRGVVIDQYQAMPYYLARFLQARRVFP
ncbi:MAG: C40 family peptidase [Bacteroidota bacterium]